MTVTMGTPGTFDYEIARRVARRAEVRRETIDLTQSPYDEDHLVSLLCGARTPTWAFDFFYHRLIPARFGPEATYWSGFMGDVLAGGSLPRGRARPGRRRSPTSLRKTGSAGRSPSRAPASCRGGAPRQAAVRAGRPALRRPARLRDPAAALRPAHGDRRRLSLQDSVPSPEWVRFILGVPSSHRGYREQLYVAILRKSFPSLFSLPTKNTFGLPVATPGWAVTGRRRLSKGVALLRRGGVGALLRPGPFPDPLQMLNYVDFERGLAERADLRHLIHDALRALDDRGAVPLAQRHGTVEAAAALARRGRGRVGADPPLVARAPPES